MVVAAADLRAPARADAAMPTVQVVDGFDLTDVLTGAALPTAGLITVAVNPDGTASFALPRAEVGQGITTAIAMVIAEEMDLALDQVHMTLADARPELLFNQLTGGSNSVHSLYNQVRVAAAIAKGQLTAAAAKALATPAQGLKIKHGIICAPDGRATNYGSLTKRAAARRSKAVVARLKSPSQFSLVGTPQRRIDAVAAVTGQKQFALDLDVPNALPTMVCRPPTINGSVQGVANLDQVKAMPGVTDVAVIPHSKLVAGGVAVRAQTFGQCIDAVRALSVNWAPGPAAGKSDASVLSDLQQAELPEIWSCLKSPVWAQEQLASLLGLSVGNVTVHVTEGGGSFGRHLFADAAFEAAAISKAMGKPVRLMWHRTDNFRQGRVHPMCTSRVRISYLANNVLAFDQRHTSVATDFGHGLGELLSAQVSNLPDGNFLAYSQSIFTLTANVPYNFGAVTQLLNEVYNDDVTFNTSSVRNIYSPEVTTAKEVMVDQVAKKMGQDPLQFRRAFARDDRMKGVLDAVAKAASWGRSMPAGAAQGIGVHHEYKAFAACVAEIDCRAATVNRTVKDGYTGPRVTKVVFAVDVGLPINPLGLQAQMMGGIQDAIAQALSYSLHLQDGPFLEGSWDNAYYTRQWNVPLDVQVIVLPPTGTDPGGAGELGVAAAMAAVANAYARATGNVPTSFPINHGAPLGFDPLPTVPPIPQSPTDGLSEVH